MVVVLPDSKDRRQTVAPGLWLAKARGSSLDRDDLERRVRGIRVEDPNLIDARAGDERAHRIVYENNVGRFILPSGWSG
ncbi:MAG: hypothetical protein R3F11_12470 [Verrucomicrobiales bacterium]